MQTINKQVETCPDCSKDTELVKLGSEPAREICVGFCQWEGVTLQ